MADESTDSLRLQVRPRTVALAPGLVPAAAPAPDAGVRPLV